MLPCIHTRTSSCLKKGCVDVSSHCVVSYRTPLEDLCAASHPCAKAVITIAFAQGEGGLCIDELHYRARRLNQQGQGELGCLLAHVNAQAYAIAHSIDFILEDSVRLSCRGLEQMWLGAQALRGGQAGMVYVGYLGSDEHLVRRALMHGF